jgi:murein DD-endopeptidase MepM/ murein hydrolase activator NlpD
MHYPGVVKRFALPWLVLLCSWAGAAELQLPPGGIVRWPGEAIAGCGVGDETWAPIGGACWYPVDLLAEPGPLVIRRWRAVGLEERLVVVSEYPYPTQELSVAPKHVHPDEAALRRIADENHDIAALWKRRGPARFSLPLARPLVELEGGTNFGRRRIFNGEPRSPHSGVDFRAAAGTPVLAVAAGEVALVGDHYFAGKSVFVDHGDGLISMVFHLDTIEVSEGQMVERGQRLGQVGATGRTTGPHLHFGLRWRGARVDPMLLISSLSKVPTIHR